MSYLAHHPLKRRKVLQCSQFRANYESGAKIPTLREVWFIFPPPPCINRTLTKLIPHVNHKVLLMPFKNYSSCHVNKHTFITSFLFCQTLSSLIYHIYRKSIIKQLNLHSPSIFPPDDSKRPPKVPTFGDFLSQGRTQGPRGDRSRGKGQGQKQSYR